MSVPSPSIGRGSLRALVRVLALLLVPVVLVAVPNVASAATIYGDELPVTVGLSDVAMDEFSCVASAQWVVPDTTGLLSPYVMFGNIKCSSTMLLANQYDCDTADCSRLEVSVSGDGCAASGEALVTSGPVGNSGWATFGGPSLTLDPLCNVSGVCISFDGYANNMIDFGADQECVPLPLGVAPTEEPTEIGQCASGGPTSAPAWRWVWGGEIGTGSDHAYDIDIYGDFKKGAPLRQFRAGVVIPYQGTHYVWYDAPLVQQPDGSYKARMLDYYTRIDAIRSQIMGVVVFREGVYGNEPVVPSPGLGPSHVFSGSGTPDVGGTVGVTAPDSCVWYWGPKIFDNTGTTFDEPMGPLGADGEGAPSGGDQGTPLDPDSTAPPAAVDPVDEGCTTGFSIWKPTTWAAAGYCEIVSGLNAVLRGLMRIPEAIWDAAAGALSPSEGYLDARVSVTKDKLNDTTPGLRPTCSTT